MTPIRSMILVLAVASTPWFGSTAQAENDGRQWPGNPRKVAAERPVTKWETDTIVRQRMENIRQIVASKQADIWQDRLDSRDYQQLAEAINTNIDHLVKDCKLTQAADAALHTVVLTDLTRSSELMRTSPKRAAQRAGALGALQSLRLYGEYFEHPGWMIAQAR